MDVVQRVRGHAGRVTATSAIASKARVKVSATPSSASAYRGDDGRPMIGPSLCGTLGCSRRPSAHRCITPEAATLYLATEIVEIRAHWALPSGRSLSPPS
jgi:hypothetical protein